MPIDAEFEEKEYEVPLYVELGRTLDNLWAPGQVLESEVGFDGALNVASDLVWKLLGYARAKPGVVLSTINWGR
jgi:hypothetical protein